MPSKLRIKRMKRKQKYEQQKKRKMEMALKMKEEHKQKVVNQKQLYFKMIRKWKAKRNIWPFVCKKCKYKSFSDFERYMKHLRHHRRWLDKVHQRYTNQLIMNSRVSTKSASSKGRRGSISSKQKIGQRFRKRRPVKVGYAVGAKEDETVDVHFENLSFKCSQCLISFPNINAFRRHALDAHSGDVSCVCYRCGECFKEKAALQQHEKTHQDTNALPSPKPVEKVMNDLIKRSTCSSVCCSVIDSEENLGTHTAKCEGNTSDLPKKRDRPIVNDGGNPQCKHSEDVKVAPSQGLHHHTGDDKIQDARIKLEHNTLSINSKPPIDNPQQRQESHDSASTSIPRQTGSSCEKESANVLSGEGTNIGVKQDCRSSSANRKQVEYVCSSCMQSFSDPDQLLRHTKMHTERHCCPHCGKVFISAITLELHIAKRHKIKSVSSCSEQVQSVSKEHKLKSSDTKENITKSKEQWQETVGFVARTSSGQIRYVCLYCSKAFFQRSALDNHCSKNHWVCSECGTICEMEKALAEHKTKYHSKFRHQSGCRCKKCSRAPESRLPDAKHVAGSAENIQDGIDGKEGATKFTIVKRHSVRNLRVKHKVNAGPKITASTSKTSKKRAVPVKRGMVSEKVQLRCPDCEECYQDESELEIHKICHTSDKQYLCVLCVKSFKDLNNLLKHIADDKSHLEPDNCPICGKLIKTRKCLPEHVIGHYGVQPYPCSACDKRFSSKIYLRQHMGWHKGKYKCDECGKHCQSATILKLHKRKHSDKTHYTCNKCGKGFKHLKSQKTHICETDAENREKKKDGPRPFFCKVCGNAYSRNTSLQIHVRAKHSSTPPEPLPCSKCEKIFASKRGFQYHMITAHSKTGLPKPYLCTQCGKRFPNSTNLKYHTLSSHSLVKPFQCSICQQRFGTKHSLRIHTQAKHLNDRRHLCSVCGARFVGKTTLTVHMRSHTKEKPFKCQYCSKCYVHKSQLTNHERVHTGERPYTCCDCKCQFRTAEQLNLHKKLKHMEDNPHVCSVCGEKCATAGHLKAHMNYHIKPFQCGICGRGFGRKTTMRDHEKRHGKSTIGSRINPQGKPYQCKFCFKNFEKKSKQEDHERTHTGELPFSCETCSKKFCNTQELIVHKKTMHPDDYPHACSICNRRYSTSSHLSLHMMTHTRPYTCPVCRKGFASNSKLKKHKKSHDRAKTGGCNDEETEALVQSIQIKGRTNTELQESIDAKKKIPHKYQANFVETLQQDKVKVENMNQCKPRSHAGGGFVDVEFHPPVTEVKEEHFYNVL